MKKLMVLAVLAALCANAWAEYTITYKLTVANIDSYVQDKTVSPYGLSWGDEAGTLPKDMVCAIIDSTVKDASTATGYKTLGAVDVYKAYLAPSLAASVNINKPTGDIKSWSAVMNAKQTITDDSFTPYMGDANRAKLKTVVYSESRGMYQIADINALEGDATGIGSVMSFAPTPAPSPEPTSGMLLLLGLAGLALKRKRA